MVEAGGRVSPFLSLSFSLCRRSFGRQHGSTPRVYKRVPGAGKRIPMLDAKLTRKQAIPRQD